MLQKLATRPTHFVRVALLLVFVSVADAYGLLCVQARKKPYASRPGDIIKNLLGRIDIPPTRFSPLEKCAARQQKAFTQTEDLVHRSLIPYNSALFLARPAF